MANKSSVGFGLRPIGKIGQNRDASGLSEYDVAASATAIFFNDAVKALNTGTIGVAAAGDTLLGSLNGAFYTDPTTKKPTFANNVPSIAATDMVAFISDDPYERFEIRSDNTAASEQTDIFNNADITYVAGNTINFVSKTTLADASLTTSSAQLQILGVTKDSGDNDLTSSHVVFVVRINEHQLTTTTGV